MSIRVFPSLSVIETKPMNTRSQLANTPATMHSWAGAQQNRLCGDSWGDPDSPAVLLLHGGGQTRHSWQRTARHLAQAGFYAVTFDARGHGDSEWVANGDYGEAAMAQDLACVVRAIGATRPVLIGASLGGITSLVALANKMVDASALILADVAHVSTTEGFERVRVFMTRHANGFASLDEAAAAISSYRGGSQPRGNPRGLAKNLRQGSDGRLYWHWDPRFLEGRKEDLAARNQRLAQYVRQLSVPTLLVRGARSDVVTDEAVREFLALCPHASHVDVAGAGHMLTGDDNDVFGQMAVSFIRQAK